MKIVCGRCSAEVELPKEGESPQIRCPSCAAVFVLPSLAEGEELARPDAFPGYRVVALVGHGGMGAVYRAVQLSMDREVAIKVLLRKYAKVPRFVARFERESGALAALNHPNIVGVIDRGRMGETYYFVMEYVHGRTLRYLVRSGQVGVDRAVDVAGQICRALEAAHAAGVVHRDIKPGNILIEEEHGLVKVADFGIAHMVEEESSVARERRSRLGTAKYMAPEQRGTGEGIDARADIYGLGVTLHEMLTGELPSGTPPSVTNRFVPKELDAIVERATRPNRDERFQSAVEMRQALEAIGEIVQGEETAVTEEAPAVPSEGPACPVCHMAVRADDVTCSACGALVREPCFHPDCEGMNLLGAERCSLCGGHLRLLEKQRRAELEGLLRQAESESSAGRIAEARELLEVVERDPHAVFADLRSKARTLDLRLPAARRASPWRLPVAAAMAAAAVAGLALLIYWQVTKGLLNPPPDEGNHEVQLTTARHVSPPIRPDTRSTVQPPSALAKPRDALRDYLLAVTDESWPKQAPEFRLVAASDAVLCLAAGRNDGQVSKRLLKTLGEGGRGDALTPDLIRARATAALDALCGLLGAQFSRPQGLAKRVKPILAQYAAAARSAADPQRKLDLAAATLYELAAAAEAYRNPKLDLPARLLLLDASLGDASQGDLLSASSRLLRAGQLLLRQSRREGDDAPFPEFLNDAQQRLSQAEQVKEPWARLACGLEACVEALAARPSLRATD